MRFTDARGRQHVAVFYALKTLIAAFNLGSRGAKAIVRPSKLDAKQLVLLV